MGPVELINVIFPDRLGKKIEKKNFEKNFLLPLGLEPLMSAWQAAMLPTEPQRLCKRLVFLTKIYL